MRLLIAVISALTITCFSAEKEITGVNLLGQISQAFTEIADEAMPATVFIKAQVTASHADGLNTFEMFNEDFFRRFFPVNPAAVLF